MSTANESPTINRRNLLFWATGTVGVAGIGAAAWPLIDQMNPDAAAPREASLEIRLDELQAGAHRMLRWREMPILIAHRTAAMVKALQDPSVASRRLNPPSQARQQPPYAANWHRSADPDYAVLIAICTYCRCVPAFFAEADALTVAGGTICPCCASRFDAAGRAYDGPAQFDLPVPPHRIAGGTLVVGRTGADGGFSINKIERL